MYNIKNNALGRENEVKLEELPLLSAVKQDIQQGYIADIFTAL